jgi:hypothetical protein
MKRQKSKIEEIYRREMLSAFEVSIQIINEINSTMIFNTAQIIHIKIRKSMMYGGQQRMYCHLMAICFASDNACPVPNVCTNSSNEFSGRPVGKAANY